MNAKLLSRHRKGLKIRVWRTFRSHRVCPFTENNILPQATVDCYWCSEKLTRKQFTVDHLIPLCKGGSHNLINLVPACFECNQKRSWGENIVKENFFGSLKCLQIFYSF